jgi:hypothetical protein
MYNEELMIGRTIYRGDGTEIHRSNRELATYICAQNSLPARMSDLVGKRCKAFAGAPGVGHHTWEVTRVDEKGIWGRTIENTIRVMDFIED